MLAEAESGSEDGQTSLRQEPKKVSGPSSTGFAGSSTVCSMILFGGSSWWFNSLVLVLFNQ